jgi:DNA-binding NarL/FixJ family response regulator
MSGLRVWASVREHARVLAMPVRFLVSPVVGSTAGLCATVPPASTGQRAVRTIRVTIAHPQRLFRAGLRALLEREASIAVVDEAANADEAVALARRLQPDVVLIDVSLPGLGCVEVTRRILDETPVAVMLLAASETDDRVLATLRAGAASLLLEDCEPAALVRAVRLLGGGRRLRARRPRRRQPAREVPMLTPKVTELSRGSAHRSATGLAKASAISRQRG